MRVKKLFDNCQYSKENSSLEQNLYLHNQMHIISVKVPQKERRRILNFSQELQ